MRNPFTPKPKPVAPAAPAPDPTSDPARQTPPPVAPDDLVLVELRFWTTREAAAWLTNQNIPAALRKYYAIGVLTSFWVFQSARELTGRGDQRAAAAAAWPSQKGGAEMIADLVSMGELAKQLADATKESQP